MKNLLKDRDFVRENPFYASAKKQFQAYETKGLTTTNSAGVVEDDILADFFVEKLADANVAVELGARMYTTLNNTTVPVGTGFPETFYHAEGTSDITADTGFTIGSTGFDFKTLATKEIKISRELLEDEGGMIAAMLDDAISKSINNAIMAAIFSGASGSGQPVGLDNLANVETYSASGLISASDYDDIINAVHQLIDNKVNPANIGLLHGSNVGKQIQKLRDDYGAYLAAPPLWTNMQKRLSTAIPNNRGDGTTRIYMGDWSQLLIGMHPSSPVRLRLIERNADALQVSFIAYIRYDLCFLRPDNFLIMTGITTDTTT